MTKSNSPNLRFKEFTDEWQEKKLGDLLELNLREIKKPTEPYLAIGIRSHFKGTFQKPESDPLKIAMDKLYVVKKDDFLVNITFAWEAAAAIAVDEDDGGLVSHRFPTYIFKKDQIISNFFRYIYPTKKFKYLLGLASPGGAGRNRVLIKSELLNINFNIPSIGEQQKIADFLGVVDKKIEKLEEKKKAFEKYKKGVMQEIFSQKIRFKDKNGKNYPDWEEKKLGELLNYEQPTKYIVRSTEYSNDFDTPVLTAGKSFILGYTNEIDNTFQELPVIIFDDFTTASQFVDFPFKVKSSAMKILKAKEKENIRFIFEAMQKIKYEVGGHGRHWISVFANMKIKIPSPEEQETIVEFLTALDDKINLINNQLEQTKIFKKSLLQRMFV